ncbi:MAG: phosphatase PAP2 family protein [Gaiellaceae bacterium]
MIEATSYDPEGMPTPRRRLRPQASFLRLDTMDVAATEGAARIRRWMAVLLMAYAGVLALRSGLAGRVPSVAYGLMAAGALAVYKNMLGRFLRDWALVFAGLFAYLMTGHFQPAFHVGVHFRPQLELDRALGFGTVPTIWLQEHLYSGRIGWLEIGSTLAYLSHFVAPLVVGLYLWFGRRSRAFAELMFGILVVSVLADITYVLAPTAPPWLAARHGYIPPVHHIVKGGLVHLHLGGLAAMDGDSSKYNVVAALPSMHVAFPAIALLVLIRHRLPSWLIGLQAFQLGAVIFAIVYTGEHYMSDALVAFVYVVFALALVRRALDRVPATAARVSRSVSGGARVAPKTR